MSYRDELVQRIKEGGCGENDPPLPLDFIRMAIGTGVGNAFQ